MATTQTSTLTVRGATWEFQNLSDYNQILADLQNTSNVTITLQDSGLFKITFDYTAIVAPG